MLDIRHRHVPGIYVTPTVAPLPLCQQEALKEAVEDAGFEATLLSQGGLETLTLKVGGGRGAERRGGGGARCTVGDGVRLYCAGGHSVRRGDAGR